MARKSRKINPDAPTKVTEKIYNTAVYARLSIEDCRDKESDSIENQIYLIKQYIEERPYLKLCSVFADNGETGTNFNRPQFIAMMDAVKAAKIDCIVVKDLSRFGRTYIETGEYLERIFPFMGVRFVSINDGLDNEDANSNTDALLVSLKNLINDVYAKDISQKVISSLRTKQQNGEYIGGLPPYGYKKSPQNKHVLEIDEEVAHVVKDIFAWKAEGVGDTIIARRLNELGIASPAKRHVENGNIKKTHQYKVYLWRDRTIRMITTNPMYIGHMTQGRQRQALCDNKPQKQLPQSEWIIVENTHAPIVDIARFEKAQEARENNTSAFYKNYDKSKHISSENYIFKGILYCHDCGSKLLRIKSNSNSDTCNYSFVCPVKRRNLGSNCNNKNVHATVLYDMVLQSIKCQINVSTNLLALIETFCKTQNAKKNKDSIASQMATTQKELKRLTNLKASLFETYADKLLSENEYIYSKQKYEVEMVSLRQKLEALQEESVTHSETLTPKNKWLVAFQRFIHHDELSYDMAKVLINKIVIRNNTDFDIVWNFKSEYDALIECTGEGTK